MKALLWLILILLVIGILWWLFNRNRSTQSGVPTSRIGGSSAGGSSTGGGSSGASATGASTTAGSSSAAPEQPSAPAEPGLHSAPSPAATPREEPAAFVAEPVTPRDEPAAFVAEPVAPADTAPEPPGVPPVTDTPSASQPAASAPADPAPVDDTPLATEAVAATGTASDGTTDRTETTGVGSGSAPGKFGAGSADPDPDGSGPAGWSIKGNEDSMKYHTEESPWYGRTVAEVWFETEDAAKTAGFKRWDDRDDAAPAAFAAAPPPGKFGAGSADPGPDGSGPAGWSIKGNEDSMKFHTEESPWYERTVAEVWFDSEEHAIAAGFKHWDDRG